MPETLLLVGGLALGAGLGWLVTRIHGRSRLLHERETLGTRLAAAEALGDELRKQLTQRELELGEVRATLDTERTLRAQAETRSQAARENLEEQKALLAEARERLGDTFKALSADALRQSTAAFMEQAKETVGAQFDHRREAIDTLVKPLQEALIRYERELRELETKRERAYGSLEEQLRALTDSSADLQRETGNLVGALRSPSIRGRWGEITLHRVVELAGMVENCDYVEQVTVQGEGGRVRPDLIVRLPGGRQIVVDAKVPLSAYLDAVAASSPEERRVALLRHAQQLRQHMMLLAGKAYWEEFGGAAQFVVMFIPADTFVSAAVEVDPALLEDGMARRVVVASPATLIGLLHAGAYGWRQEHLAENAERISELGRLLYDRLRTMGKHFDDVGRALKRATEAFNQAVGSMETRVLPAARKFRDLGAATGGEIPPLEVVDQQPRELAAPEFPRQLDAPGLAP
ncbi:MAG TPA: DNA recombination protein RmuC [Methylomirabilota bacterium]|nr:DNA recombination protein RmuC [Methylomirabilota bacterium]